MSDSRYQLFGDLRAEELSALDADIRARGIKVAVEYDEDGNVLDGHHRVAIAEKYGLEIPSVVRHFDNEQEKREHVIKLNLARRHLEPHQWGQAFKMLLEVRGVKLGSGRPKKDTKYPFIADVAKEVGVVEVTAKKRLAQARLYDSLTPEEKQTVDDREKNLQQIKRERKDAERAEKEQFAVAKVAEAETIEEALQQSKFSTIVVDPPWDWGDEGDHSQLGRGRTTYGGLSIDELLNPSDDSKFANLEQFADADCHIYLWITNRSLPKGFALLERWGFRYVTCLTWCKPSIGMGNYFRGSTEHVLFGVRGSLPLKRKDVGTWFSADRGSSGEHSAKPDAFYKLVQSCSPGPYLDVFARKEREGWICWGGELS